MSSTSAYREFTGKSVEEALRLAREDFGVGLDDLDFEILTPGSRGVLGMGAEPARILAAPRSELGGAAPKREAAAARPLPPPPPRDRERDDRGRRARLRPGPWRRLRPRPRSAPGRPRPRPRAATVAAASTATAARGRETAAAVRSRPRPSPRRAAPPGAAMRRPPTSARPSERADEAPVAEARRARIGPARHARDDDRAPRRDDRAARAVDDRGPRRCDDARPRRGAADLTAGEEAEVAAARGSVAAERAELEAAEASPEALAAGKVILDAAARPHRASPPGSTSRPARRAGSTSSATASEREELGALIGRKGERLSALQHLVNLMLSRQMGAWTRVLVDVEDYRGRRERQLREIAERAAKRVVETGKMLQLEPMPALERRWIHLALKGNPDVATQSIGEEPNRRIVVLPRA